jgi:hypothetical protein
MYLVENLVSLNDVLIRNTIGISLSIFEIRFSKKNIEYFESKHRTVFLGVFPRHWHLEKKTVTNRNRLI